MTIHPIILAGGSGTRLWPVSRAEKPKQFVRLNGETSLFQDTLTRLQGQGFADPLVITHQNFEFMVADQAAAIDTKLGHVIVEPEGRNTGPAVFTASLSLDASPEDLMLVLPADHQIRDAVALMRAVEAGVPAAEAGKLVTFGIQPDQPETGYGYLEPIAPIEEGQTGPLDLKSFVEKPDYETAKSFVEDGKHLWNAGIFLFRVGSLIEAVELLAPAISRPCQDALRKAVYRGKSIALDAETYATCPSISIDHAVMAMSSDLAVVPLSCGWSDFGSWQAVWQAGDDDAYGNVVSGAATAIDCQHSLLRSEREGIEVVGLGLYNIAAIATGDAVLVANMDDSEAVKQVVETLKMKDAPQATEAQERQRPWGYYETLALGGRFQVKRIVVKPGGKLSLQSHIHRSEHWVVVSGYARVTVGDDIKLMGENQSVYISAGEVHRLENPGKVPLTLIEVQTGPYLGEDDIIRYEDVYDRVQ